MTELRRISKTFNLSITSTESVSNEVVDYRRLTMGVLHMDSDWDEANIGFQVSHDFSGDYIPLYDQNGNRVQIASPAADGAYALPPALAGVEFFKIVSEDSAGVAVPQTENLTLYLSGKS